MQSEGVSVRGRLVASVGIVAVLVLINTWLAAANVAGVTRSVIVFAGVAAMAMGVATAWWLFRSVLAPMSQAVVAARQISDGDLTGHWNLQVGGELGQLLTALQALRERIFRVVSEVRTGTTTVAGTSSQISRDNSALSERTANQATSLASTSQSMSQITSTVTQNAGNAEQANELVTSASERAVRGGQVVSQVVSTMGSIKDSSRKIVDIIGVIDSIAFQTNILALNAAVEAARAGEQGRGFAVVATEVRTLAKRSAEAAKQIKSLISDSVAKVDSGSKLVDEAGVTMGEIVSSVQLVADIMRRISDESREQSTDIQTVNKSITQIDKMIKKNAELVNEANKTSTTLNEYAVSLLKSVSTFNLGTREYGNAEEAVSMVQRACQYAREHGNDALLADINKLGKGVFIDRDLYLMAIGIDDTKFHAHGNNPRVLGHGPQSKDVDGKMFVVEMAALARNVGSGWVDYKWAHPITNEVKLKSSYVERSGDMVIACGIYKI